MNSTASLDEHHHRLALSSLGSLSLSVFLLVAQATQYVLSSAKPQVPQPQPEQSSSLRQEVRQLIEHGMGCWPVPAAAVAVVKDGEVLLSDGYGVSNLDTRRPVTSDTKFVIASLTKAFTAALLVNVTTENGKRMSSTFKRVLGQSVRFNNSLRTVYATPEDLLAHRLGVPRNSFMRLGSDFSIQALAEKIRYLPSVGGFRDSSYYSDLMYGLSAYVTERLQPGRSWKQQMRETLFTPLGMHNSTFVDDVDFQNDDDVATPYLRENDRMVEASVDFLKHWGRNLGSGNIVSSANDLAKWMLMLLNKGRTEQGLRVLSEEVMEDVFQPQNVVYGDSSNAAKIRKPLASHSWTTDNYALGWKLGYYKGYRMIFHSGSTFAYRAYLTLLPEMKVGVVTLMTGKDATYGMRIPLHMYLMDRALGQTPWIDKNSICSFPDLPNTRNKRSADLFEAGLEGEEEEDPPETRETYSRIKREVALLPEQAYEGSYQHSAYGTLQVRYNETLQSLVLEFGIGLWRLQSTGGHGFYGSWLKLPPTISGEFKFFVNDRDVVYAVEATKFERKKPPKFMLMG